MPAKGPGFGSSGRVGGGARGASKRGGAFLSKQGSTYTSNSASRASKNESINSAGANRKAFRKGNAAANRDLGRTKAEDRRFAKKQAGRLGSEGPKRSAPVKKKK